jgi:hypothetical protein
MGSDRSLGPRDIGSVSEAALDYAAHGWPVFPVHGIAERRCGCGAPDCSSPGKHPLTRRGLKDATTDADVVAAWWRRWPRANVALATGCVSGVIVIDVDPPRGEHSLGRLVAAGYELPETITVRTGSGGMHLYFAAPGFRVGNTTGRLPGVPFELDGVDLRADGGYVVAPPSAHVTGSRYTWIAGDLEPAPAPQWLAPEREAPASTPPPPVKVELPGATSPYGRAALEGEVAELRRAPVGTRNHTLNRCAFRLGRLVAGGELNESEVVVVLRSEGIGRGLTPREIERTIASGLAAGLRHPRCRPRN